MHRLHAAVETLGLIGLAAGVVHRNGRTLAANRLLESLTNHVQWLPHRRLVMVDQKANQLLIQALAGLAKTHGVGVQSFPSRPRRQEPAVVHVVPAARLARDLGDDGLAVLVLAPVTTPAAPDTGLIRSLFGLSPGEARVARAIAQGRTIDQIAEESGVSRETVRTQVKAILAKTGTSRQAEMALLLAGLPKMASR
jgi:DNA-binding CsgD family transcriptional regulator